MRRERSCGSVTITSLDRDEALAALREAARRLRAAHGEMTSVWLFGSLVRGDHVGASDADVLGELAPGTPGWALDWVRRCLRHFDLPIGVDVIVLRQDEAARRVAADDPFFTRLWRERLPLA